MSEDDLKELELKMGPRKRILQLIQLSKEGNQEVEVSILHAYYSYKFKLLRQKQTVFIMLVINFMCLWNISFILHSNFNLFKKTQKWK